MGCYYYPHSINDEPQVERGQEKNLPEDTQPAK